VGDSTITRFDPGVSPGFSRDRAVARLLVVRRVFFSIVQPENIAETDFACQQRLLWKRPPAVSALCARRGN